MSESNYLLRLMVQADNEFKATNVTVTYVPTLFTSQLTSGYTRKGFSAYNNSLAGSGECYWGGSTVTTGNGQVIPKGAIVEIPVSDNLDVYFVGTSGEIHDLRVLEIA